DARFVCFQNDDGTHVYYATFTAFDGKLVLPELVETSDFLRFRFITLNGPAAENKGMALFPRKINDLYAILSRRTTRAFTSCFPTMSTSGMNARCSLNRCSRGRWSSLGTAGPRLRPKQAGWSSATESGP